MEALISYISNGNFRKIGKLENLRKLEPIALMVNV